MEFDRALGVAARGVPTITPLAVGVRCEGPYAGESYLVTGAIEKVMALDVFINTALPSLPPWRLALIRRNLARELGRLIARVHNAGILHRDLHAANLLVRLDPENHIRLFLADLHAVRLGPPLDWRTSRENLVILNRWFSLQVGRTDRRRFWQEYCRARPLFASQHGHDLRELARELDGRTWVSNRLFWRQRDRRCLVTNRYYQRVHGNGTSGMVVRDLDRRIADQLLADPDGPFRSSAAKILKDSRSSTVAELEWVINGQVQPLIYKRFRATTWHDRWARLVRRGPALRSWVFGHGLRERGLRTARPLAVIHRRRGALSCDSYLLTEKIQPAVNLRRWVDNLAALPAKQRQFSLRQRIDQVAKLARDLHKRHLSHRDLKALNILVADDKLWLIDLDGVTRHRRLTRARRAQNLARLHVSFHQNPNVSRTDKLRFLRAYMLWGLMGKGGWKKWWHKIATKSLAKIARNHRRGRPLA
jgi:tRNA A-37 threonylcarbamoyl transferase component Bud32